MIIDVFIFPIIIFLSLLLGQHNSSQNRKMYIILVSIILLLKACLRGSLVGNDTAGYLWEFNQVIETPWREILLGFVDRYGTLSGEYDLGYTLLQKIISMFTKDFHVFTFIAQLLFYAPFGVLLFRFCSDFLQLTFAYVFYVSLFMGLPMSNARQFYSIGFCVMAFLCLYDKKLYKGLLCVVLGSLIHQSSLLFVLPFVLSFFSAKIIKKGVVVSFALFPLVLAFSNQIIFFMGNTIENERYAQYGLQTIQGGAYTYIAASLLMCLYCYAAIKDKYLISNKYIHLFYVMLPLTVFFCPLIRSNGSMIRIVMYFQLFFVVLFPYALDHVFTKNSRSLIYIICIVLLMFMDLRSADNDYYFFWQQQGTLSY